MARLVCLGLLLGSALILPSVAAAEDPPEQVSTLVVYGDDPCPAAEGDEIVVCARRPESERYRIPKPLREKEVDPAQTAWATRMATVEDVTRDTWGAGCSVVGSNGLAGCFAEMLRRWSAERREVQVTP